MLPPPENELLFHLLFEGQTKFLRTWMDAQLAELMGVIVELLGTKCAVAKQDGKQEDVGAEEETRVVKDLRDAEGFSALS